jgi:hypothetical protein
VKNQIINGKCPGGPGCAHKVEIQWNDHCRKNQVGRFEKLQVQVCDGAGQQLWDIIQEQVRTFAPGVRVDVPSPRLLARLIGLYRTGATLKCDPMLELELSAEEIARFTGYCKSQVEAALRWLGDASITYLGEVVAQGLGVIERTARIGKIKMCKVVRGVFRTSLTKLSALGRGIAGLVAAARQEHEGVPQSVANERAAARKREKNAAQRGAVRKATAAVQRRCKVEQENKPPSQSADEPSTWSPLRQYFEERARRMMTVTTAL